MAARRSRCRRSRWLVLLLLLAGAAAFVWKRRTAGNAAPAAEPSWPPMEPAARPFASARQPEPERAAPEPATWVLPNADGTCPDGYPIKGNDNSRIFHVPGGRFYDRTVPERCYATSDDAAADGYRQAKA